MLTRLNRSRILAGVAGILLLSACFQYTGEECRIDHCPTSEYEVYFHDTLWRRMDTLGASGLIISFEQAHLTANAATATSAFVSASAQSDCAACSGFFVADSAVITADRPIVSPDGDTVPAGANILAQPWKDKLGRGDVYFYFHPDVRFESGRNAFAITVPWAFKKTRVILGDTSYLVVP